jgi:hypothetical protein
MKQYAILKDAVRNEHFGIVVKSGDALQFFGLTEHGTEWSKWANSVKSAESVLPDGITVSEFSTLTEDILVKFDIDSSEVEVKSEVLTESRRFNKFVESKSLSSASKLVSISDTRLSDCGIHNFTAVNFKARLFRGEQAKSELALKTRFGQLAFNHEISRFNPRPNSATKSIEFANIRKKINSGAERRFGQQIVKSINNSISEVKVEDDWTKRRAKIGAKTAEVFEFHEKGLGRAIGRAVFGRGRGRGRGRGGMGGNTSRFIAGVLDPSKRRDVDGDGMIFDGTWREMPDPTRFKPGARVPNRMPGGGAQRPYRPGQDTGAPTMVDDIPGKDNDSLIDDLNYLENRVYPINGDVTTPRQDKERAVAIRKELRKRGILRRDIQARDPLANAFERMRNDERSGLRSQRGDKKPNVTPKDRPAEKPKDPSKMTKEEIDDLLYDLRTDWKQRKRSMEADLGEDMFYWEDEEIAKRFMDDYGMTKREAAKAVDEYRDLYDEYTQAQMDYDERRAELLDAKEKAPFEDDVPESGQEPSRARGLASRRGGRERESMGNRRGQLLPEIPEPTDEEFEKMRESAREAAARRAEVVARQQGNKVPSGEEVGDNIIEELLDRADGANDGITPLLEKLKKNKLSDDEKSDLLEMLNDEFKNGDLAGDERLNKLIKKIKKGPQDQSGPDLEGLRRQFGSRGLDSSNENSEVIDELLESASGANDSITPKLQKLKIWPRLDDNEKADIIEELTNEYNNGELADDPRLKKLIDDLKGGGSTSRGLTSQRVRTVDDAKKIMRDNFNSAQAGGADLDSGIRAVARGLGLDSDTEDQLSQLIYDGGPGDSLISEIDATDKEKSILREAVLEFAYLDGGAKRGPVSTSEDARQIMRDSFRSAQAGGADLDSGIRAVAQGLGLPKDAEDKLSQLIYDGGPGDSLISEIARDNEERDILKDAVLEFANLDAGKEGGPISENEAKKIIRDSFESARAGGADLDSGIRSVARGLGLPKDAEDKLSQLIYDGGPGDSLIGEIARDDEERDILKEAVLEFARLDGGNDDIESANDARRIIRESFNSSMAGGADRDAGIRRIARGLGIRPADEEKLAEIVNETSGPGDSTIMEITNDPDKRNILKEAILEQARLDAGERRGLASRNTRRQRNAVPQNMSSRRAAATTERAAAPRGLASDRPKQKVKKKTSGVVPGVDAVSEDDGRFWETLTPEQKKIVQETLTNSKKELEKVLKGRYQTWWNAQVRGAQKQGIRGGTFAPRSPDDALNFGDITEMQRQLDIAISTGKVESVALDENGKPKINKDGTPKQSRAEALQKEIDALSVVLNMEKAKDFSKLEHLHPAQKGKILEAIKTRGDSKFKAGTKSTFFGRAGGITKTVDDVTRATEDAKKNANVDKRTIKFRERILRVNPERARRRELRKNRVSNKPGRRGEILDPTLAAKQKKLRAQAKIRGIKSKFKGKRDAAQVTKQIEGQRAELHPLTFNPDGSITMTPEFPDMIAFLSGSLHANKKKGEKADQKVFDRLLADLWENTGFAQKPILIRPEEIDALIKAGWQPIVRGTGGEKVNSEGYVEQFLTSEGRFIPGQGARAYGVGEYFTFPGESRWDGGYTGGENDKHTILALVPPTANIVSQSELSSEVRKLQDHLKKISERVGEVGGRDSAAAMSTPELVKELREAAGDMSDDTRASQIIKGMLDLLEQKDNAGEDTSQLRGQVVDGLDYMKRIADHNDIGHVAPLLGVDGHEPDGESGVFLLHNRGAVAAVQRPLTRKEGKELGQFKKSLWKSWGRDKVTSPAPESAPAAPKAPKAPKAPRAAKPAPTNAYSKVDVSGWKKTGGQRGSNPGGTFTDSAGVEHYIKTPDTPLHAENEALASTLYKMVGVNAADVRVGDDGGKAKTVSKIVQGTRSATSSDKKQMQSAFVADAWLSNWDAVLNDNTLIDSSGKPVKIDVGGSMLFRARGGAKGAQFGDTVGEIDTLRQRNSVYADVTDAQIKEQVKALKSVSADMIKAQVKAILTDSAQATKLADTLIARRQDLINRFG